LKEFEQLARAALGADEGIAANEPEETSVDSAPPAGAANAAESAAISDLTPTSSNESPNVPQSRGEELADSAGAGADVESPKSRAESAS
jgi:hypothetical protein